MQRPIRFLLLGLTLLASGHLAAQSNAPSNLSGTAAAYNQINLTWKDNATNETKFEIERKDFVAFTKIGEVAANTTSYQDKTVQANGSYTYRVRVVFPTGAFAYSGEVTVTTPQEPPGEPTNVVAAAQGSNSIKISWGNGSGSTPTDYQIERGPASGGPFTLVQTVAYSRTPTFTDNGVTGGAQYCYRLRARNGGGQSGYSATACATTPLAPTNINNLKATTLSSNAIKLTWNGYGKETGISIERRIGQTGNWSRIATPLADGGEYTDNGLNSNTEYCYRILEEGHEYSAVVCATTQQSAPSAPARLTVSATSSSEIKLQWADLSDNESNFQIERASSSTAPFTKIGEVGVNSISFSDQNLSASTQYCYRVRATNAAGASNYTDIQCATTPAPPVGIPQNLVATAVSTTQINLSWTGVAGAKSYQLERSPNGTDNWNKIADPSGDTTGYNDAALSPNTHYFYRIRAIIDGNAGPYSTVATAITPDSPPAAPARLTATVVSYNQINLQWADGSTNESNFQVERSTDGTTFAKIADVGANTTMYSDPSLQAQTHYYYRVRAVNAAGTSDYSNVADATTPVGPPPAPQNLVATAASTTQINLTWTAVANATSILIERSPNGNDGWAQMSNIAGTSTTYSDPNLTQNTHYYYRIRGTNASGDGPYSNVANAITPDAPPAAPARLTATAVSATQIDLAWADVANNEATVEIERSPDGSTGWTKIADASANATTYQNTGLTPVTHYFYRIRAVNAAGNSAYSNTADATTPDVPPTAPASLTITPASATQLNLSWTDQSANETGFEVERGTSQTGTFTKIADLPATTTTYQDSGLTPAATYCYRVRAKNTIGLSDYSNVMCAATPDVPPPAPSRLTATVVSTSQITLVWTDGSTNESGFDVERATSSTGTFAKVADLPANATTYEDKNLTDNTQYCYRVRAKNAAGNSAYTDNVCATTPLAPPAAPANLTAQVSDYDQIRLNWSPLGASAVTVSIERATNPGGPFAEIKQLPAVTMTSYVDAGLQEFTTYYYRIRAINPAGNSAYSNTASARIEEVIIAVEDEFITQTTLAVQTRTLLINTNWQRTAEASLQLLTPTGREIMLDHRRVRPQDSWHYDLTTHPAGVYILRIVSDGRTFANRFLLP